MEKPYKIAICEDEKIFVNNLVEQIRDLGYKYEIEVFNSGEDFLNSPTEYFVVFLDIELGGMNGYEVAKELQKRDFTGNIVITTSHRENITEAFELNVSRYLLKPIQKNKLEEAMVTALRRLEEDGDIVLIYGGKVNVVALSRVTCVRASRDDSIFYDIYGNEFLSNRPLSYWKEKFLERNFFRVHKSFLVAMRHVEKMPQKGIIKVKGKSEGIPVSRFQVSQFRENYLQYVRKYAKCIMY